MPNKEELTALTQREFETLEIYLWGSSMRSAVTIEEFIKVSLAQGASKEAVKEYLLNDLKTGGRIFGEFKSATKATAKGSVHRFRDTAEFSELGTGGQKYRWVAVLVNTCPDCEVRHGVIKTWDDWEAEGLPRAGYTVCKQHCRCVLFPAESTEMEIIKRPKKDKK